MLVFLIIKRLAKVRCGAVRRRARREAGGHCVGKKAFLWCVAHAKLISVRLKGKGPNMTPPFEINSPRRKEAGKLFPDGVCYGIGF